MTKPQRECLTTLDRSKVINPDVRYVIKSAAGFIAVDLTEAIGLIQFGKISGSGGEGTS